MGFLTMGVLINFISCLQIGDHGTKVWHMDCSSTGHIPLGGLAPPLYPQVVIFFAQILPGKIYPVQRHKLQFSKANFVVHLMAPP